MSMLLDDSLGTNRLANITLEDDATGDFLFFGEPVVGSGGVRVAASTAATGGLLASGAVGLALAGLAMRRRRPTNRLG